MPTRQRPTRHRDHPRLISGCLIGTALCLLTAVGDGGSSPVQADTMAHRPVSEVRVDGLSEVPEQLVRNQIRLNAGDPYDPEIVRQDIVRLTYLGRFATVQAKREALPDGSVRLTYVLAEQPLLVGVEVVGNKALNDEELLRQAILRPGDPVDHFPMDRGRHQIIQAYHQKGYFAVDVSIDEQVLADQRILIFRIREGPRVRIRGFNFEGNSVFEDRELRKEIKSDRHIPLLRSGNLSREQLELDAGALRQFYRNHGYLDAQVGRRIDLAPNQSDAMVTFVVEEGDRYLVGEVHVAGAKIFSDEQIRMAMELVPGSVYSQQAQSRSSQQLETMYGRLGFLDTRVRINRLFDENTPTVDVHVTVEEGAPSVVGQVQVAGNRVTQSKVVLRRVRGMDPGRPFDRSGVDETRRLLMNSRLFSDATVTLLGGSGDPVRDVLIEVQETSTGSLAIGAGVSSDAGVIGAIDVSQRNFDIADFPESWSELFSGDAFRGAGQTFNLSLQPGNTNSQYSIGFREPHLFESDYFFDTRFGLFQREREDFDENRLSAGFGIGKNFGDVWSASVNARLDQVDIRNIDPAAPVDVFAVEGENLVTGLGLTLVRSTVDHGIVPTRGGRTRLTLSQAGLLGGDFDFTRLDFDHQHFWTLHEDFLGRRSVLSARMRLGYIFQEDEAPVFERFYAGGHSSFRGFTFRGIGPRGIRNDNGQLGDDPVGGDFMMLASLQYEVPLIDDYLRGVIFTDQGTVEEDLGLRDWRVSVGAGIRIKMPIFGQAPFAIDFAIPIKKEKGDETRIISFDLALPFR